MRSPCLLFLLCHTPAFPRVLGCHTPEAAWKVFVGASVPICFQFILCCLEPWLMVFMVRPCSLFTPFHVTAVHATRGVRVHVWRLGVASQPVFPYNVQEQEFFLCLLTQEGPSDQSSFRVGVLKILLGYYPRLKFSAFRT